MPLSEYVRSTPFRVAATYTIVFVLSAAVLFGILYGLVTREMTRNLEAAVELDMRPLLAAYSEGDIRRLVEAVRARAQAARPGEAILLLQTGDGAVLAGNVVPFPPFTGWRELTVAGIDPGGGAGRVLALGARLGSAFLLVGRDRGAIDKAQSLLLRSLAWTLGVTFILAMAGGIVLGRGALRRLEAINRATREIVEGNLSRRLPAGGTHDEMDRLAGNINRMLDRIEELMANLQQVTNDIAHDLRTPLGRLRQRLEAARADDGGGEERRASLDRAIEETDTILSTFSAILRIAQIESKARRSRFASVDLSEIATRVIEAYESVAEDAGQWLRGTIAPGVSVWGDRDLLTQMLANLVENAIHHCPHAHIAVDLAVAGDGPVLIVADTGPGIPAGERDKVLRRFYRLEKDRPTPGSGLGLALVKGVADLHSAALELADNEPGLKVTVRFPAIAANPNGTAA